jgi:hypothetical protein
MKREESIKMRNDINVDSPLSFSVLVDDELSKFDYQIESIKLRIQELCELAFKVGFKAGQRPENNLKYKDISK